MKGQVTEHVADHFFKGVCICPCTRCLVRGKNPNMVQCVCKPCPVDLCGIKTMRMVTV